ncbi:MAG: gliding motility-associated protein GldE [Muribaculaceae bacterium]|nr:gliding motility-associated protein GldE [Muribaculaceae bacterium]
MDIDPLPATPCMGLLNILLTSMVSFQAPPSWATWSIIVAIACFCLLASAFMSGSEIAYFGLTPADIDELSECEEPGARKAYAMLRHSEQLLATVLVGNNLVNITMVVLLTFAINQTVTFTSPVADFLVQTVFLTFLLLLFGEIFPKLVARGNARRWIDATVGIMSTIYTVLSPLTRLMVRSTAIVNRLVTKKQENISTDQLEAALEISDLKEGQDKEMLEGILSFGEKQVSDIMISRVDVTAIEYHDSWEEVMHVILETGYSRIPVYDTSQDKIRGILYSKDLLPYLGRRDSGFEWQKLLRKAYFVPGSRMIDDLLEDFRKRKMHIAIVIDEYGGTEGIVTMEDIIEEIVGEIDDEYDDTKALYRRIGPDTYIFEARIPLGDFCDALGISEESLGDVGEAETLAGLLLEVKGDFPTPKEEIECGPCLFQVVKMERHRIVKVKVTLIHKKETDGD